MGCWIPTPGINTTAVEGIIGDNTLFQLISAIGGNALTQGALLAIGISPYINASIIIQLLTVAIPPLEKLTHQGEDGKRKIETVTRFVTLALAIAQAVGIAVSWNTQGGLKPIFGMEDTAWVAVIVSVILVAGSMITMWLGERITEAGIGNGISLLIFVGIIATAGLSMQSQIATIITSTGDQQSQAIWMLILFLLLSIAIFVFIIWIDLAERKIPVNYAKQIKGRKQYGGQSTFIPIKVNANGVMPIIFATAIITFPQVIFQLISSGSANDPNSTLTKVYTWWSEWLGVGRPIYFVAMALLILGFSYFYSKIQFQPDEVARNLQQYGGTITGIRPGKPTAEHLAKISNRLTLFGAIFLTIISVVPSLVFSLVFTTTTGASLVNAFTATGLLIVVSVALELNKQLESQLMMKHYKGFLK